MATNKVYVGDVGTVIILDTGVDVSVASTLQIKYKKPDGSTGTWNAQAWDTTKLKYVTDVGDLDQVGTMTLQAYAVISSWTGHGETVTFEVYDLFA